MINSATLAPCASARAADVCLYTATTPLFPSKDSLRDHRAPSPDRVHRRSPYERVPQSPTFHPQRPFKTHSSRRRASGSLLTPLSKVPRHERSTLLPSPARRTSDKDLALCGQVMITTIQRYVNFRRQLRQRAPAPQTNRDPHIDD
jgi:hypothetical protein